MSCTDLQHLLWQHHWIADCHVVRHPVDSVPAALMLLNADGIAAFRTQGRAFVLKILRTYLAENQNTTVIPCYWHLSAFLPGYSQAKVRCKSEHFWANALDEPIWLTHQQQGETWLFNAIVPLELKFFVGHFPTFPLVPGAVELQWIMGLIRQYCGVKQPVLRFDNLKFQKFLRPNDSLEITLKREQEKYRVRFQLMTEGETCASGWVVFYAE
ncbi:ApeI family dehydratase [Necropsobacter massiliensis]|uniref:ApeI family dehydratase n=1 Tax=Necropsobacter massiliensis TaxID=1400001 RepID=UPI000660E773|nr:hypothetical protein [Necropsobacter massiliensis]